TADSVLGWRFVNPRLPREWTVGLGETAEIVAAGHDCPREEQDAFALESQRRAAAAIAEGRFRDEMVPVEVQDARGGMALVAEDEHPRPATTPEALAALRPAFRPGGT